MDREYCCLTDCGKPIVQNKLKQDELYTAKQVFYENDVMASGLVTIPKWQEINKDEEIAETIGFEKDIFPKSLQRLEELKTEAIQKAAYFAWLWGDKTKSSLDFWLEGKKYVEDNLKTMKDISIYLKKHR